MKKYMENGFANDDGNECLLEIGPYPHQQSLTGIMKNIQSFQT